MEVGTRITFLNTVDQERVSSHYGTIYEKYPVLEYKYEVKSFDGSVFILRNWDHPHHIIMWWIDFENGEYYIGGTTIKAEFETIFSP